MKAFAIFLGLVIGALSQIHRPTTLPSYPPRPVGPTHSNNPPVKYRYYCSRYRNQSCQRNVAPACGWYDQKRIRCHTFPCAANFSNPCVACNNLNIKYVTCEQCPHTNAPVSTLNYEDSTTGRFPTCMARS